MQNTIPYSLHFVKLNTVNWTWKSDILIQFLIHYILNWFQAEILDLFPLSHFFWSVLHLYKGQEVSAIWNKLASLFLDEALLILIIIIISFGDYFRFCLF